MLEKIGAGGMGEVYRAHDEQLGRDVAIKVLLALSDPAARSRLWREARAAASLNHPNVCQLYEIGEENGVLFLAMELLDGESLAVRLLRGPLPCAEAVQIALTLDTLRADPAFTKILRHAEVRHRQAVAAFVQADGERLLGLKVSR